MPVGFNEADFLKLSERIDQLEQDKRISKRSQGLIYLLIVQRFLRESDDFREALVDGGNDCGVDAIFIDHKPDQPIVNIIQSKVYDSAERASKAFKSSALEKISRFFEILKDPNSNLDKIVSPSLKQKILEIRALQREDFPIFKVWLISNGCQCVPHEIGTLAKRFLLADVTVQEFHLTDFVEFCINLHSSRPEHTFHVRESGIIESGDTELYSVVGYISARELYSILQDLRDERKMDYSLFDMNVRSFLGLDSPINKEIFKSAMSKNNSQFSSLNNGITVVGTHVKVMKMGDRPKIGIKKMSIVNGAQTCSAIFDCMKDQYPDFSRFDKLSILFRLFKTDDPEMIEKIAISTNNQNRIQPRDLRANDNYQLELEKKLAEHGIRYVRKRGSFQNAADERPHLDALRAGQLLLAYVHQDPAAAKKQSDHIFSEWYSRIFSCVDVSQLLRAYALYEKIESRQEFIQDEVRIRGVSRTENTFITYGGFHILALCGVLEKSADAESDDDLINKAIDIIAELLQDMGQPAYYSFFRDSKVMEKMINKCSQPSLFPLLKSVES